MKKQIKALKSIMVLSVGGMLFSGYLSYLELFTGGCESSPIRCGGSFYLFSLPACVYGFIMYTIVFLISVWGVKEK